MHMGLERWILQLGTIAITSQEWLMQALTQRNLSEGDKASREGARRYE
jgi:hypothetical protein